MSKLIFREMQPKKSHPLSLLYLACTTSGMRDYINKNTVYTYELNLYGIDARTIGTSIINAVCYGGLSLDIPLCQHLT